MCGVAGFLGGEWNGDSASSLLKLMTNTIAHRGPDAEGQWVDPDTGIALGHRRLAIVDLSAAGAQPMQSESSQFILVFNGEIYNHADLRIELEKNFQAPAWRGHSDTETLLACFEVWGVKATLERSIGMFAFALWCRKTRKLTLGRDRLGEKPLYYGWQGAGCQRVFLFGSELKALAAHPVFSADVNRDALCVYMRHGTVGGSLSIFCGISKLLPGSLLSVSLENPVPEISSYWSAAESAIRGASLPFQGTPDAAVNELEFLLKDAVKKQMSADVPLGAFLSGGIDSSLIVALMQSQSMRRVKTFSIGFNDGQFDEAVHAKAVAAHLGTEHTELYVTPSQAMDVISLLPTLYDEPFADSSQIPTYLVSKLARQHVSVSLSGDAGDELFCGYSRYSFVSSLWDKISFSPRALCSGFAWAITRLSPSLLSSISSSLPLFNRWNHFGDKVHKGAALISAQSLDALYRQFISSWHPPECLVINGSEPLISSRDYSGKLGDIEQLMLLDLEGYLPNDILTKVDRAAMGVSLETRVPFLDHRVVDFALSLPLSYKLSRVNGQLVPKWVLKQILYKHVPRVLIERPKMGFAVPISTWLRGPLRDWAENLLDFNLLHDGGFLNAHLVRAKWREHISGRRNWHNQLWPVLMFQAWLQEQRKFEVVG